MTKKITVTVATPALDGKLAATHPFVVVINATRIQFRTLPEALSCGVGAHHAYVECGTDSTFSIDDACVEMYKAA